MKPIFAKYLKEEKTRKLYRGVLLGACMLFSFAALTLPIESRPDSLPISIGDVATRDLIAPRAAQYQSQVLTVKARKDAADLVAAKYLPSNPGINRTQLARLEENVDFITSVREDIYSDNGSKTKDLMAIPSIVLSEKNAHLLLSLTAEQWEVVQQEAFLVLEQTMRRTIRESQIQESVNLIPSLVSYSFSQDDLELIVELVAPLVAANSEYSVAETDNARKAASDQTAPIVRTFVENQAIVLRGQVITPEQWEALDYFNLIRPTRKIQDFSATLAIILVLASFITLYFSRRKISSIFELRNLTVVAIGFVLFLFAARILIPNRTIIPFFFPISAYALILVTLFNLEISIFFSLVLSILVTHGLFNNGELTIFYIITSLMGAIAIGKGKKVTQFMWSGIVIALSGILVITAYKLNDPITDFVGLVTLYGVSVLTGFASASLALLMQFLLAQLLGIPTPMHLVEISRSDHPLLKKLMLQAPGTYQHSLQVANLAELAAERIGADALLTRVGTLFHDVGKSFNSIFFIENQLPGAVNSHEDMDPVVAAQTIIQHVSKGVELADKYRLPPRLKDFIREHHGNQVTRYQYNRSLQQQNNDLNMVDMELFRYPGPTPQTRETAILMLADGCEARVRAELPKTDQELQLIIRKVFDFITSEGLLENTNLTLRDLKAIEDSFFQTLSNTHHPRIQYPEVSSNPEPEKKEKI